MTCLRHALVPLITLQSLLAQPRTAAVSAGIPASTQTAEYPPVCQKLSASEQPFSDSKLQHNFSSAFSGLYKSAETRENFAQIKTGTNSVMN